MKLINTLAFISAVAVTANASANQLVQPVEAKPVSSMTVSGNKRVQQYIVELSEQPELEFKSQLTKSAGSVLSASSVNSSIQAHKQKLISQQSQLMARVKSLHPSATMKRSYTGITNSVAVETSLGIEQLQKLSNVKAVYPVQYYTAKLANALPIIEADEAWQLLGGMTQAGRNIRVAVIDSGIVPNHPMFSDSGFTAPSSVPSDDYCRTTQASFCNDKLIAARYYKPSFVDDSFGEFDSPQGLSGHGTHVAGIATGRQVTAPNGETFSGVAPGAYLMVYKALWGQDGEGTDIELLAALEDAAADGADIINNSWGGSNGQNPNASLYNSVFQQLEQNGIVVVTAAGNEGEDDNGNVVEQSIACPGCVEAGITVGATTTDLVNGVPVTFGNSTFYAQQSDAFNPSSAISGTAALAPTGNELGCDAWSNNISGQIAVVSRGTCTFEVKANNAQQAGASAMVVVNNIAGTTITMSMGGATLPAVMLSMSDGVSLTSAINQSPQSALTIAANSVLASDSQVQDRMGRFSSLGPNGDDSFIKPDMAAPGVTILSATSQDDEGTPGVDYAYLNGTSMATPMVAGAAAILKQANPSYTAIQVKNILVNSADAVVLDPFGAEKASAFETGAGRLNVLNAMNTKTYAAKPNMAKTPCVLNCQISNDLNLIGSTSATWTASVEFDNDEIGAQVSPVQVNLTAAQPQQPFTVDIMVPTSLSQGWHFGRLKWTDANGAELNQAIAINHSQESTPLLQAEVTDKDASTKTLTLTSQNISSDETLRVKLDVSGGAAFVDGSLDIDTAQPVTFNNQDDKSIDLQSEVALGGATISSGSVPVSVDLAETTLTPLDCDLPGNDDGCDEVLFQVDFAFEHFGESYDALFISDNGIVIAGDDISQANYSLNQQMPSATAPNNVIAPFWTDFDLSNPNLAGDTGGGDFILGTSELNGQRYLIVQWDKVKLWSNEDEGIDANYWGVSSTDIEFTFQLIIQENSDNKWFRYLSIPEQPNFYSVGVEDKNGIVGAGHWYNGEGQSAANSGDELSLQSSELGTLSLTVDMTKQASERFSQNDSFNVVEDEMTTLNVAANDAASVDDALLSISVADANYFEQIFDSGENISLDLSSVTITSEPTNGTAQVMASGLIEYTPNANFSGTDSLSYQITNSEGDSSSSVVNLTVEAVNDAPVISQLTGPDAIDAGASGVFTVVASDVESDNLTYQWTLPADMSSSDLTSSTLTATVNSSLTTNRQVAVSVTVSDGTVSVTQQVNVSLTASTQTTPPANTPTSDSSSGGGSFGTVAVMFGLLLLFIRRRRLG